MRRLEFTEEQEKAIIDYYLVPHSLKETSSFFNISRTALTNFLKRKNITFHSKEITKQLNKENTEKAILLKYGVKTPMESSICKQKLAEINLKKYGSISPFGNKNVCEKAKQTKLEKYGDKHYHNAAQMKQTCLERYGVSTNLQIKETREKAIQNSKTEETKEKRKATCLKRYGAINNLVSDEQKEKTRQLCLKKYGVEHYTQTIECQTKIENTMLKKYGTKTIFGSEYFKNQCLERYGLPFAPAEKYRFNNEKFDSLPELCFYLYHIENKNIIKRHPIRLSYVVEAKKHFYFPDFEVDNVLYEIKGSQFLNEKTNTWQCPYDHTLDSLYEAKRQCAIKNNVKILYNKDYQKYVDWFYNQGYKKEDFIV